MADFEIPENPDFVESVRKFEPTDPAHADLFNRVILALLESLAYLRKYKADMDYVDSSYQQGTGYTDKKIADLINGAPETLDTLKEIADAIAENKTIVEALDSAIGKKANQIELDTHTGNNVIHITSAEHEGLTEAIKHTKTEHVTGVKGSAESVYRTENVEITAENVGAVPVGGNAGSATTVQDYNDTSKKIQVGWVGSALNEDQILAIACYSSGDDDTVKAKIKDVTKDTFKSWLGTVPSADRAARLGRNGNAGYPMTFNWAGKDGQPTWLWGGENGSDMYVYNPSNFSVNYAASAGNAAKVNDHTVDSDVPSNAKFTDTNTWRGIQDNLTSASTVESLSANQGRKLANGSARDSTKIPLTGSTEITGNLIPKTHAEKTLGDSTHYWKEAYINNVYGEVNGHAVNADVPSNAVFTDTKGSVASNNGVSSGYAMLTLASGYKILAFHTVARNYAMTNNYGNMYWASFEIPIPVTGIKYFTSVNVTPFATSGLISVSITNYTVSKIQGFVFSPLAETKNISFHVTVHGTAS